MLVTLGGRHFGTSSKARNKIDRFGCWGGRILGMEKRRNLKMLKCLWLSQPWKDRKSGPVASLRCVRYLNCPVLSLGQPMYFLCSLPHNILSLCSFTTQSAWLLQKRSVEGQDWMQQNRLNRLWAAGVEVIFQRTSYSCAVSIEFNWLLI